MGKHYGLDIPTLHELRVDCDKDWQGFGISSLKEVVEAMGHGDITFKTTSRPILVKLPPFYGAGAHFLHTKSIGGGKFEPEWKDIQDLIAYVTGGVNRAVDIPILTVPGPPSIDLETEVRMGFIFQITMPTLDVPEPPSIDVATAVSVVPAQAAEETVDVPTPSVSKELALRYAVGGAVADDGGVQIDETAAANNPTANDMTLLPAVPAVNDAYYFGYSALWDWLMLNIGTGGDGVWTIVWEYWNGTSWASLPDIVDGTNHFGNAGTNEVTFTRPGDWATTTVGGIANLYWIRARVSSYTSIVTQPLGTQCWAWVKQ